MSEISLEKLNPSEFESIYKIMLNAFPPSELRTKQGQRNLLDNEHYTLYTYKENGEILGFITGWKIDGMDFVEHFAVDERCRGKGLGANIMKAYIENFTDGKVFLEVELPDTDIAKRRIGFYERLGFKYNDRFDYIQPAMQPGQKELPLKIMSYPDYVSEETFENKVLKVRDYVYSQKQ